MSRFAFLLLFTLLLFTDATTPTSRHPRSTRFPSAPPTLSHPLSPSAAVWTIDVSKPLVSVSPDLYGIFFEEINHSGTGGLWNQQLMNSNFEDTRTIVAPWKPLDAHNRYQLVLDEEQPINGVNPVSLQVVTDGAGATAGVVNPGYWGINVSAGLQFTGSVYLRSDTVKSVSVALFDPSTTFAETVIDGVMPHWMKFNFSLTTKQAGTASFRLTWQTTGKTDRVNIDVVTLFPTLGWQGLPWLRPDLAQAVADLHPAFMRFPGGCFVEGQIIANRFNWKKALGPIEHRAGHWNLWGYWSEDGLGLYEYLQFIERLTDPYGKPTRAIWVVNNGVSHEESIAPQDLEPYVQDALDSIEFAQGGADTYWGSRRAQMGHAAPFHIDYVAIGNEDCGKPHYADNYRAFFTALNASWPDIKLISNCDPTDRSFAGQTTQVWDYHTYPSSANMLRDRNTFDAAHWRTDSSAKIFNSEYAVKEDAGAGNAIAALAEAAWMNGLERNSDLVVIASYAPLFVNVNDKFWLPDTIVFNASHVYGTPSYWNQLLYSNSFAGTVSGSVQTLAYTLDQADSISVAVALATLNGVEAQVRASNIVLVHKIVNFGAQDTPLTISLTNLPASAKLNPTLEVTYMQASDPHQENTFEAPRAMAPKMTQLKVDGPSFTTTFPAYSIFIVKAYATV